MIPTGDNIFGSRYLATIETGLDWYYMKAYSHPVLFRFYMHQPLVIEMVSATCLSLNR